MNGICNTISRNLLDLLYPLHCDCCRKALDPLSKTSVCDECRRSLSLNPAPYCQKCGRSVGSDFSLCDECLKKSFRFARAYSAGLYETSLKDLIKMFKYNGKKRLAETLSEIIDQFVRANAEMLEGIDIASFVPIDIYRANNRGFNQSEILAAGISKSFGIPLLDTLDKVHRTKRQNELSRDERLINLKYAFKVKNGSDVRDLRVLLVDDVMTTGATLDECAGALLDAGAAEIRCLTLARGL